MAPQTPTPKTNDDKSKPKPIVCLGQTFASDAERRAHFTEILREKLKEPAFRAIEGFPIAEDEDILALSDPPYYTACPNPWIAEFVEQWEEEKPAPETDEPYHREPFAADVSEGKNDPIYNAHSYHTKVPHKAIMRYILHYTVPGDIVFDGFCGTGMTGVAAQMCGDRSVVESLGYRVEADGTILQKEFSEETEKEVWTPFSKLGARRAVLNDLSPAATFIAYNYNTPVDVKEFEREANRILAEVEEECGWMYTTLHEPTAEELKAFTDAAESGSVETLKALIRGKGATRAPLAGSKHIGKIKYTVWSDVFVCPECAEEIIFYDEAVDKEAGKFMDEFPCANCGALLTKRKMERAWVTKYDTAIDETIRQSKQIPVLINYTAGKKRHEKIPDAFDKALIAMIERIEIPYWYPTNKIPKGDKTSDPFKIGIVNVHHYYTKRNLWVLANALDKSKNSQNSRLTIWLTASMIRTTKMYKFTLDRKMGTVNGTLYIPSLWTENGAFKLLKYKIGDMKKVESAKIFNLSFCSSFGQTQIQNNNIDYIFIDPPFGSNLMYSELNFIWESWLKVLTNNQQEVIENRTQGKSSVDYRALMLECFREAYRILKPGRWMTVEFSNTKAAVWNSIQTALTDAGFIVANVSALDKKQGTFNAVTTTTAVKQDLVISAYKPNGGFEERFVKEAATEEGVWDFVKTHLKYLPVTKMQGKDLVQVPERDPRILFDQMVAYYVRKGHLVPISSPEFQIGLKQRFIDRDGMYFLPKQVSEYDRKKLSGASIAQTTLFVSDEASAIQWLRVHLRERPQTFQEIHPTFIQETQRGWSKNEVGLELGTLLEQNFLKYDGAGDVPSQIHTYLSSNWKELRNLSKDDPVLKKKATDRWYVPDPNKAADLEKLREKALLREFDEYMGETKRLKIFRIEAVRAGFKKAWQEKDYRTIIAVAKRIPPTVLEEDPKLLMWYDQAITRVGE